MGKSAVGKVMWIGRATVFLVGLAVILALVFGAASVAWGATGGKFILGKTNLATTLSTLVRQGPGPALSLQVASGPPLAVNSSSKVTNFNADKVDDLNSTDFVRGQGARVYGTKVEHLDSDTEALLMETRTPQLRIDALCNKPPVPPGEGYSTSIRFTNASTSAPVELFLEGERVDPPWYRQLAPGKSLLYSSDGSSRTSVLVDQGGERVQIDTWVMAKTSITGAFEGCTAAAQALESQR